MLYTIVPEHLIFPVEEGVYETYETVTIQGALMCVRQNGYGTYELIQLLSTDPNHYLQFTPGQEIIL